MSKMITWKSVDTYVHDKTVDRTITATNAYFLVVSKSD